MEISIIVASCRADYKSKKNAAIPADAFLSRLDDWRVTESPTLRRTPLRARHPSHPGIT
jgi:hypothetical protein